MMTNIPILEIFGPTLQGEGPNAGVRCIFVRVMYCDYKCSFCDTKTTWAGSGLTSSTYTPSDLANYLLDKCIKDNCYHVVLTGGNPCLYDFSEVILTLHSKHIKVDVETQGSILPDWLHLLDQIVFSPKGPSSGMPDTYDKIVQYIAENDYIQSAHVAIKIPVFNKEDIDFARKYAAFVNEFTAKHENYINLRMYLSVGNSDVDTRESIRDRVLSDYESLLNQINEDPESFEHIYILPQIHTLVWGNKSGV